MAPYRLPALVFIGKGISSNKHVNVFLLSLFFAFNIHRVYIKVSFDVLLDPCF